MAGTKSIASLSSRRADTNVSEYIRSVATSVFSSLALGREECLTDASSYEDDDQHFSTMFEPVEFIKRKNECHNNGYNRNHNFLQNSSSNIVLTENDKAWFHGCHMESDMDEYAEASAESMQWNDDIVETPIHFPVSFQSTRMENDITRIRSARKNGHDSERWKPKHHHNKDPLCDLTVIVLLALCTVLTLILGILIGIIDPFGNKNATIISSNNGTEFHPSTSQQTTVPIVPEIPATTNTSLAIPTVAPIDSSTTMNPVIVPSREPTIHPTIAPTTRPTTFVLRIPPSIANEEQSLESSEAIISNTPANNIVKPKVPSLSMGPMVGHTTHDSVTLWAYHEDTNDAIEVLLYNYTSDALLQKVNFDSSRSERNGAFVETIRGLQSSTSYKYGIHIRGERVGKGSFTTAPLPNIDIGTQFDYVLASCINYRQYKNQIVWDVIANKLGGRYPDFSILAGDTVYLQEGVDVTNENGVDFDRLWFRNLEQRNEPHFAKFIGRVPTYATWNDHEYGSNNANKDQKGKASSLKAWKALWPNPGYGDDDTDDGVYYSYYWGDVHYIVTDDHWYRDPSKKNRLGTRQTEWIAKELIDSKGTFKVIVIGSDIMERGWSSDLNNIGDIVRENRINGVVFHAGDIHRNEYKEMITGGFPYPVKQISSSGIAKVWRRPFVHVRIDTTVDDPSMTAFFYGASSTAEITTWTNNPSLVCSSIEGIDRTKEHTCTETIRLSDVTVPPR